MFYRLGTPYTQSGVNGIIFPVQWSRTEDPFETFHSGTMIVAGFIDDSGQLRYSENDLDMQLLRMEDIVTATDTRIAEDKLPKGLMSRINKPGQVKRKPS